MKKYKLLMGIVFAVSLCFVCGDTAAAVDIVQQPEDSLDRTLAEKPAVSSKKSKPITFSAGGAINESVVQKFRPKNAPSMVRYGFDFVKVSGSELRGTDLTNIRVRGGLSRLSTNAQAGVQLIVDW